MSYSGESYHEKQNRNKGTIRGPPQKTHDGTRKKKHETQKRQSEHALE